MVVHGPVAVSQVQVYCGNDLSDSVNKQCGQLRIVARSELAEEPKIASIPAA